MSNYLRLNSNHGNLSNFAPILAKDMFVSKALPQQQLPPRANINNPRPYREVKPIVKTGKRIKDLPEMILTQNQPLMGTCYTVGKCVEKFYCILCSQEFHMKVTIGHLTGNSHRLKYCDAHFPTLSKELNQIKDVGLHSFLGEVLNVVATIVTELSPNKLPTLFEKSYFNRNEEQVRKQIINAPHVSRNTLSGLENILLNAVLRKTDEYIQSKVAVEIMPPKNEKPVAAQLSHKIDMHQSIQVTSVNATRDFPKVLNFYELMYYLECIKPHCNLDEDKIKRLIEQSMDLEDKMKKSSNMLFEMEMEFLLEVRQKIISTDYENENIKTLASYVQSQIKEELFTRGIKKFEDDDINQTVASPQHVFYNPEINEPNSLVLNFPDLRIDSYHSQIFYITSNSPIPIMFKTNVLNTSINKLEWYDAHYMGVNSL